MRKIIVSFFASMLKTKMLFHFLFSLYSVYALRIMRITLVAAWLLEPHNQLCLLMCEGFPVS